MGETERDEAQGSERRSVWRRSLFVPVEGSKELCMFEHGLRID